MATTDVLPLAPSAEVAGVADPVRAPVVTRSAPVTSRPMPPLLHDEPAGYRWSWLLVALAVTALFAAVVFTFYAPADAGVDQNAYLLGGRLIAQKHTTRYVLPVVPVPTKAGDTNLGGYAFTGGMMVRMPNGDYFPKYPAGLPLLYACFFWLLGPDKGPVWAFVVSPASAVAAVLGTFFLARAVAGSFAAVMAALLLGTSQVMLSLADNPNSHASCTAVVVWGMFLLVRWWQTGSIWQGVLAGFLIGYSFTIRYTEGLLVLPVAIACLTRLRWGHWAPWALSSVVAALAVAFVLALGVWTSPDWDVNQGIDRWFGTGRTGPTVAAIGAVCFAITWLGIALLATFTVNRPAWWTSAVEASRWSEWGLGVQVSGIVTAVTALVIVPLIGLRVYLKISPAAVADPAEWFGDHGRTGWWIVVAVLMGYSLTVGAISAIVTGMHWRWWTGFLRNVVPGLAWCVPVVALVVYNSATMRHAAGYDTTNESKIGVAFKWSFVVQNWELVVRTFDDAELFFVVPFAVAGMALVFRRSWRVGLVLLTWFLPGVLLYTSYYWSNMQIDVAYTRFYLSFLPALCVGVAVAFHDGLLGGRVGGAGRSIHTLWRPWVPAIEVSAALAAIGGLLVVAGLWTAHDWDLANGLGHWIGPNKTGLTLAGAALLAYATVAAGAVVVAGLKPGTMSWSTLAALGGRIPTTLAVGVVVAVAASVSSYRATKGLRDGNENVIPLVDNFRTRLNLARVGEELLGKHPEHPAGDPARTVLVDNVPARSVLFSAAGGGIQSPTNYIQFLRDWDIYPSDAFSEDGARRGFPGGGGNNRNRGNNNNRGNGGPGGRNGGGGGGMFGFGGGGGRNGAPGGGPPGGFGGGGGMGGGGPPGMGGGNNNDDQDALVPTPIQPEQQEYHASLYRNAVTKNSYRAKELYQKGGDVVRAAFAEHRRVFAIIDKDALETFEDNMDEGGRFDYKTVAAWTDVMLPADREEDTTSDDRTNRWSNRANNRRGGGMAGNGMARLFGLANQQNDWRLIEVVPEQPKVRTKK